MSMITVNEHFSKLEASYLFSDIASRVARFGTEHSDREIIRMGIGDVTLPLPDACIRAFHKAVDDMASDKTFHGYGPEKGYDFLRNKIAETDFRARGIEISSDEIFISDGAKCDTANIQELFSNTVRIAIPDPVYPVYVDTNVMAGRTGPSNAGRYDNILYLPATRENGFVPDIPSCPADLIYLCFPNNPTGATADRSRLEEWVEYARANDALILFDAAYEAFIRDDSIPRSIFEIPGADEVAIEFRSFSKNAGFTGTRCAFTVVPHACRGFMKDGSTVKLNKLWLRRQSTKFNGVSYPVQRAAEAVYSPEGRQQVSALTDYYLENAGIIRTRMTALGFDCTGGVNSPYIWVECGMPSWEFFDLLLGRAGVVCTPGSGFGNCGEGYIRISAFNSHENVMKAMDRIAETLT